MITLFVDFLSMLLVYDLLVITKQQFDEKYLKTLVLPPLVYCGTVLLFLSQENIFQDSFFVHNKLLHGWDCMGESGDNWVTHGGESQVWGPLHKREYIHVISLFFFSF